MPAEKSNAEKILEPALAEVPLNVVCFRYRRADCAEDVMKDVNQELLLQLQESGIAVISSTVLDGKFALRAAITNHRSKREDFQVLVDAVVKIGERVRADSQKGSSSKGKEPGMPGSS